MIDADEAVKIIKKYDDRWIALDTVIRITDGIANEIEAMPTVDAVVRHGNWERTDITEESGWALYRCSCCDWHTTYYYSFSASPTYNFCPNCGSKMIDRRE